MDVVCLFGGGRWARVLLGVLLDGFPKTTVIWVTQHHFLQNNEWLTDHNTHRVVLVQNAEEAWSLNPQAAIVATSSYRHGHDVKQALIRKIPVLSEKPYCFSIEEANELIALSEQDNLVAGVNFEFTYASYLDDFAAALKTTPISSIDVVWQDSFCDTRYGEKKNGDIYTPLMKDSFQHCWSLLNYLLPNEPLTLSSVTYNDDSSVVLIAHALTKQITISLSRRASERIRSISVNKGATLLNFANEPGSMLINGHLMQNEWKGSRPLLAVFQSFFKVINCPELLPQWRLSLANCREAVRLSAKACRLLEQAQQICLENKQPLRIDDEQTRNLLIDIFLPKLTSQGEYHRAHNLQEQMIFSEYVLNLLSNKSIDAAANSVATSSKAQSKWVTSQ